MNEQRALERDRFISLELRVYTAKAAKPLSYFILQRTRKLRNLSQRRCIYIKDRGGRVAVQLLCKCPDG